MLLDVVMVIVIVLLLAALVWQRVDFREMSQAFISEREHTKELAQKYDRLVDDIKALAMRPHVAAVEQKIPKARSAAELRRMFDRENEKVLADREQSR